jgi:hypothetical protein
MRSDFFNDARVAILQGDIPHALEILFKNLNDKRFGYSLQRNGLFKFKEWYWRYQKFGQLAQGGQNDGNELKRIQGEMLLLIQQLESEEIEHPPMPQAGPTGIFETIKSIVTAPLALLPSVKSALTPASVGKIVYQSPSRMRLNHVETVTVRISHKSLKEDILKEGLDAAKTREGELEISDAMEVALFEAGNQQNFDVFPVNTAEQVLNSKSYSTWSFFLNAKRVGKFNLILRVSMKVHLPELGEKKKDIVTWSTSIEVDVDSETQMENIPVRSVKWDGQFIKMLKERIANNDFGIVFQNLANHLSTCDTELFNNLVVLQTRFNNLGTAQQLGVLSYQDYTIDFNRIAGSLLSLIDEVGSPRKSGAIETYKTTLKDIAEQVA